MEAKELRLGNYIKDFNEPELILFEEVDLGLFEGLEIGTVTEDDIEPIPLTEEWLLKLGFEKKSNQMQIDGIEMTLQIDDYTHFSSCGKLGDGLVVLCLCKGYYFANNLGYVHELQNLYFALTGKELKCIGI